MLLASPAAAVDEARQTCLSIRELTIALPAGGDRDYAVNNISFDIPSGQIVCLVGESGSGKSVVAQAIMGLLPSRLRAASGRIDLLGENLLSATPKRLRALRGSRMAMIFQEPMTALNPVMRCGDQVDEMLAQHERLTAAERKRRVLAVFARVHLPDPERVYRAYPHELSGGQRQRIVIAIALILKPRLLICDEPTTALDVTTQAEILKLVRELQQDHQTAVLFITHDLGVVADIADRVVVLQLGQQIEQGSAREVLGEPRENYTRSLLQAVPRLEPMRPPQPQGAPLLLSAQGLAKSYGGGWSRRGRRVDAVSDVSLQLKAGETVGIVGESGSGKSTLARCIARLIEPNEGTISIPEQTRRLGTRAQLSSFRRHVQLVPQDPNRSLNPRRRVGDSIIEGPLNFGVPRNEALKRAEQLMELVRMRADALQRYPSEFSGGQRQRLCIARALACEPQVLIADEAVSALDVSVQAQILELLGDIQRRLALSIVFITHDLRVASQICDRIIVMQRGRIVEQGDTREVLLFPRQDYTRALLAAVPGTHFGADPGDR